MENKSEARDCQCTGAFFNRFIDWNYYIKVVAPIIPMDMLVQNGSPTESGLDLRNLEFKVHSANQVAAEQIKGLLMNYIKHLEEGYKNVLQC